MALLVGCLTLDLTSGFDLRVMGSSTALGSVLGVERTLKKKSQCKPEKLQRL